MVAGGGNVGQQGKVELELAYGGQGQAIEGGEGDLQVFGLVVDSYAAAGKMILFRLVRLFRWISMGEIVDDLVR